MSSDRRGRGDSGRVPVSVVCVFNDQAVLDSCLRRSLEDGRDSAPRTELIAVDNRGHEFTTAGEALNSGARSARSEVIAFVHQDVYLHSLPALEVAAGVLLDSAAIGILGAVGMSKHGRLVGRIRDRVVPLGDHAPSPQDVDSLDEVLVLVRRDDVVRSPLTEDPLLAWHAYAVEYSARVRRSGKRAAAFDIPITHNSMTTNLANLDLAHEKVGRLYPTLLPIHTTCGTIRPARHGAWHLLASVAQRGRGARVWLQESIRAAKMAKAAPFSSVVLADIRFLVDRAADLSGANSIRVLDLLDPGDATTVVSGLHRARLEFSVASGTLPEMADAVAGWKPGQVLLLTNLKVEALEQLRLSADLPHVVGLSRDCGVWVFIGATPRRLAILWPTWRHHPVGSLARLRPPGGRRRAAGAGA